MNTASALDSLRKIAIIRNSSVRPTDDGCQFIYKKVIIGEFKQRRRRRRQRRRNSPSTTNIKCMSQVLIIIVIKTYCVNIFFIE